MENMGTNRTFPDYYGSLEIGERPVCPRISLNDPF